MRISDWSSDVCSSDLLKDKSLFRQQCYIDGAWVDAEGGETISVDNPATRKELGTVPKMGAAETRRAIEAANKRSEEHTSELQTLMRISYAVFCLQKKKHYYTHISTNTTSNQHNKMCDL